MGVDLQRRLSVSFSGYRWRRFVPFVVFTLSLAFVQFYVLTGNTYFIKNTFKNLIHLKSPKNRSDDRLHILLISYARTGSSFVGDMLQSLPSTFYHFEPLHFLSSPVLNSSFEEARDLLDKVYRCNITSIQGFMPWQQKHKSYMKFKRSFEYWKTCSKIGLCYNTSFIDSYCRRHKLVAVKTIRLKLREAADLFLSHPHLNLKIIYLSRDPRGALNSRKKFPVSIWCKRDPVCSNQRVFCDSLEEDLQTICTLSKERPDDFLVVRYEDISLDSLPIANRLTQFLGFNSIPNEMETFLRTHTAVVGNIKEKSKAQGVDVPYSTFRNSSITAMSWRQQMPFQQISNIQRVCRNVLTGFGYYSYSTVSAARSNLNFDVNLENAIGSFCSLR